MSVWEGKKYNIISLVVGLVGIITGVWLYYLSEKRSSISYQVIEQPLKIFDKDNSSSKIKLVESDSIPITQNVYLISGQIWNSGDLPIKKEDIRKELLIFTENTDRILDYKINKQNDNESKFVLKKIDSTHLSIDWSFFDPKKGFTFQVMCMGTDIPSLKIDGKVLGIPLLENITNRSLKVIDWILIFPLILGILISIAFLVKFRYQIKTGRYVIWFRVVGLTFLIGLNIFLLYITIIYIINFFQLFSLPSPIYQL